MLRIPLTSQVNTEEQRFIEVRQEGLPDDINKLVFLLQREKVSIGYWLQLALLYYRNGQDKQFSQILGEALKDVDKRTNFHLFNNYDDRLAALNALASYYILLSETEPNQEEFKTLQQNATMLINDADNINQHDPITWITKSFSLLALGQMKQVLHIIENFRATKYNHPLALIIKAFVEFNKGNFNECLSIYKQILNDNPRCPPSIRFAMGLCYYRLGNLEKARVAFERLLEIEPDNDTAMVALAIVEIQNNIFDQTSRQKSGFLLEKAIQIDQNNPLTLKYIADHYFHTKEYKVSQKLCNRGLEILDMYRRPEISLKENPTFRKEIEFLKSDFNFILGKIEHVQEQFQQALSFYSTAVKQNNQNFSAQLGLGKIHFYLNNYQAAEQCFDTILHSTKHKDSYETLKLQAQTKARSGKKLEAVELFKRVLELNPKDHESNLEVAVLFEQSDPQHALVYYENTLKILHGNIEERKLQRGLLNVSGIQEEDIVSPELLNNIGVLRLEVGKIKEAQESFQRAIQSCSQLFKIRGEDYKTKAISITSKFNLAYWYEQHQRFGEASEIYKQIIQEEPSYVDAYLRLAYLAKNRGDIRRSIEYIELAKTNHVKKPDEFSRQTNEYCMKGKILHEIGEIQQSAQEFNQVLTSFGKGDSYAMLGIGNINYDLSTQVRSDFLRQEQFMKKAMDHYTAVLEVDDANVFATLGVGNILAEHGKLPEAMEIYKIVKESNPNIFHPLFNQAHLSMSQNNFEVAINLYKKCLEKYFPGGRNLEIEMYIAKAYFKMKLFDACKKLLTNLIIRYPQELKLKLNLALCLYYSANETFNKNFRKVSETTEAISNLKQSEKIFLTIMHQDQQMYQYLHSNISKDQRDLERKEYKDMYRICDERLNFVREMIQSSQQYLVFDEEQEQKQQIEEDEKKRKYQELQQIQEKELELELEQERIRREKEQEIEERNAEIVAKLAIESLEKGKKSRVQTQEGEQRGEFMDDEEEFMNKQSETDENMGSNFDEDFKSDFEPSDEKKEKKRDKKHRHKDRKEKKKHRKDKKKKRHHHKGEEAEGAIGENEEGKQKEIENQEGEPDQDKNVSKKRRLKRNREIEEDQGNEEQIPMQIDEPAATIPTEGEQKEQKEEEQSSLI